ncbi:MAG TPA: SlyX family protein [Myxococcaceae bacterium]|nr:SlyX family protein [Myxococcaceae bacterium]
MPPSDDRLTELELRYTEQQHLLDELSAVLRSQQQTLDTLEARLRLLEKRVEAEPGIVETSNRERPPHY